ncbi:MAG: glycosyltransferase family 4 protein, partial [Crenarchaeota archaeon]|nr:glycosyltransferase family 4 protein [Thermoproteota archaeon]
MGLKVLWFNWRCWLNPAMGGAEVFTYEIARRWVNSGNEVTLFTSEFQNCKSEEVLDGIHIVRSGGKYSVYSHAKKIYKKIFSKENYDLVIDEVNTRPFFTPKFVCNGEKIVCLIHQLAREYWFYEMPFPISYFGRYFFEDLWLKNYVNIPTLTVSDSSRSDLLDLGFKNVSVVPEGLNFNPLEEVPEKEAFPVVVYAGRLRRAKRPDHAVKSFAYIRKRFPTAELWMIGDGVFKDELMRMAGPGIRFFSGLSNAQRRDLISRAWVLVNPSIREGFGLNVIEANALGVPCVAYNVGGLRDAIINNETGILVDSMEIQSL